MGRQTKPIRAQCQAGLHRREKGRCLNDATIGVYAWHGNQTDVNLDHPKAVFCGEHKPRLYPGQSLRNVRVRRS